MFCFFIAQDESDTESVASSSIHVESDQQTTTGEILDDPDVDVPIITDVSQCKGNTIINNDDKYRLIKDRRPPASFTFPTKDYPDKKKKSGVRKRSCQHKWFSQFDFISYSTKENGLYCLACLLFAVENTTSGRAKLLIEKPYKNWKDSIADLKKHSVCDYHMTSATKMKYFVSTTENDAGRIDLLMNNKKREQIVKNREILKSILRCIEFCGRHGIALRGHEEDREGYAGNFKGLLQLCIDSGDAMLSEHVKACAKNATYSSKTSQNDFLNCIKEFIQQKIITEIRAQPHGPLFGIQADEVTDVSNREQLGLVLRYLVNDQPVERLVEFLECENTTGEALSDQILTRIDKIGLNMNQCRSQSYDGAGNMA